MSNFKSQIRQLSHLAFHFNHFDLLFYLSTALLVSFVGHLKHSLPHDLQIHFLPFSSFFGQHFCISHFEFGHCELGHYLLLETWKVVIPDHHFVQSAGHLCTNV